ncbi:annexin [Aspergillus stella-maris]|uniref:annexin n=1 Tax=Aspergillus stella-maris TaxID=1810926 RepID=UPI003CCE0840
MGLSPGYDPNHMDPGDFRREADALRKAMKGFGTDEKALIGVLAKLNPGHIAAVRATYKSHIKRDLYSDVKSETSGYFRQGLLAIIDGPLLHDTALAREAVQGIGTKEWLLDDVLLGRSNADLKAIKDSYKHTYNRTLDRDVEADLSFKTKTLYMHVLRANRHEETMGFDPGQIQHDATSIHNATSARIVNNADEVSTIFGSYSNRELVELDIVFQRRYSLTLEAHIEKTFSGHMKDAFLRMLQTAKDPAMRDAVALEECMKGMGTKDEKLVVRVARVHWDRRHLDIVKSAYQHKYGRDLVSRVKGETSGDYQRLLVAMLE